MVSGEPTPLFADNITSGAKYLLTGDTGTLYNKDIYCKLGQHREFLSSLFSLY